MRPLRPTLAECGPRCQTNASPPRSALGPHRRSCVVCAGSHPFRSCSSGGQRPTVQTSGYPTRVFPCRFGRSRSRTRRAQRLARLWLLPSSGASLRRPGNLDSNGVPTRWAPPGWRRCTVLGLWVNARSWSDGNVRGSVNRCTASGGRVLRFSWVHTGPWWVNETGCHQGCPVTRTKP